MTLSADPLTTPPKKTFPRKFIFLGNKLLILSLKHSISYSRAKYKPSYYPFLFEISFRTVFLTNIYLVTHGNNKCDTPCG